MKTPLQVLKIIKEKFMDSNYPLRYIVLDPSEDMNYSIGNLIEDTVNHFDELSSMELKYVVTRYNQNETMFIFPNWVEHHKFAKHMGIPISAGFINMNTRTCYGKSVTLRLDSRGEEDTAILRRLLGYQNE